MPSKILTPWERIEVVMRENNFTQISDFARHIGLARGEHLYQIKRGKINVSTAMAARIAAALPGTDESFLLTGKPTVLPNTIPLYTVDPVRRYREGADPDDNITMPVKTAVPLSFATVNHEVDPVENVPQYSCLMLSEVSRGTFVLGKPHLVETARATVLRYVGDDPETGHYRLWSDNPLFMPMVVEAHEIKSLFALRFVLHTY